MLTASDLSHYCGHMAPFSIRMAVADSVDTAIRLSGLTIQGVADRTGLSVSTVRRIKDGERDATVTALFAIASATSINPVRLIDGSLCKECIIK